MSGILKRQIKLLEKEEYKFFNKKRNRFIKGKMESVIEKIENKIPDKLCQTLDQAFYEGFKLVFQKGNKIIEKTYNKEKIQLEHDLNNYAIDKTMNRRSFRNMDKDVGIKKFVNTSITAVEGSGLGLMGIGLPDIPIFIGMIIKAVNEIALSYGFDYSSEKERKYILLIIATAISSGTEQRRFNKELEEFENSLIENVELCININEQMKATSKVLSNSLLVAKFIQGMAIVGVIGGVVNVSIMNKISTLASLKYKKRYIKTKM